jgi:hypothetical protein
MTKVLLIAQAPSARSDPLRPLSGSSGERLARFCDLPLPAFLDRFERVNLLPAYLGALERGDVFPASLARRRADDLRHAFEGRRVVLVGLGVARAFRFDAPPLSWRDHGGGLAATCPHPSGLNRWWNDPGRVEAATAFWRALSTS